MQHKSNYHIEPVKNGNYLMISSVDVADEDKYTCAVSTIKKEEISHALRVRSKNWKIYLSRPKPFALPAQAYMDGSTRFTVKLSLLHV